MNFLKDLINSIKQNEKNLDEKYISNSHDIYEVEYRIREIEKGEAPHQRLARHKVGITRN